jgi:hypothetical protein
MAQTHSRRQMSDEEFRQEIRQRFEELREQMRLLSEALRPNADRGSSARPSPSQSPAGGRWRQVDAIEGFVATWPEGKEHYGPMLVYEMDTEHGPVRLTIGEPRERRELYGRERGWASVWHVVNGRPAQQLANFIETDDFEVTRERAAIISGKDGAARKGFARGEESLLPDVYRDMEIEVQRDRIVGPNARNRLAVVASEDDTDTMLDHGLAHLRLRS